MSNPLSDDLGFYVGKQYCNDCGKLLTYENFPRSGRTSSGYHRVCFACNELRINDPANQRLKEFYREVNIDRSIQRNRLPEQKTYHREYLKSYNEANPEVSRIHNQKRRARKANLPDTFSVEEWFFALDYFHNSCAVCGRKACQGLRLAQDHWKPLSKSGGTTADNIIPLCHGEGGCNNNKSARDPELWLLDKYGEDAKEILERIEHYFEIVKARKK